MIIELGKMTEETKGSDSGQFEAPHPKAPG
jgi:hypothetical protein